MKAILQTELRYLSTGLVPLLIAFIFVYAILCWSVQSPAMISIICALTPLLALFTFMNADIVNGWGRYRAALPFSRRDIVAGRYGAILLATAIVIVFGFVLVQAANLIAPLAIDEFEAMPPLEAIATCDSSAAIVLIITAFMQPLLMKFGNAKGVRYATIVFLALFGLSICAISQLFDSQAMDAIAEWVVSNGTLIVVGLTIAAVAIYGASYLVSLRIYEKKDL